MVDVVYSPKGEKSTLTHDEVSLPSKASEIRCTYLQYLNLKMLPNIEYCKIIEFDMHDKEPDSI